MKHNLPLRATLPFLLGGLLLFVLFATALVTGSVHIPPGDVASILSGESVAGHEAWRYIVWETRLPAALAAMLAGAALSAAGLLLQTAFRNPLAGPSLLGLDAGANLGVALVMLLLGGSAAGVGGYSLLITAALLGSMAVLAALLVLSTAVRGDAMLLIAGLMISYLCSSLISLLNFRATEEGVRSFIIWGMGSFAAVSSDRLPAFALATSVGLLLALLLVKPLNALLLGDNYARNLGVAIRPTRALLLLTCGLLTATTTAFCGPIAFIGLAVPHLARLTLTTANHRQLLPATILLGASLTLLCHIFSTLPATSVIPINVMTPLIGAPVVIWVVVRK